MKFGVLKDIKIGECRVVATPCEVKTLTNQGAEVFVEHDAGKLAGFEDTEYIDAGGTILNTKEEIYKTCDMVAKIKEIEPSEYDLLREGQIVFSCIHPAAHPEEVEALLNKKVISFTAEDTYRYGSPNCEAAGKAGAFMGLYSMLSINGGCGKFVSGLAGAPNIKAMVLGYGLVGSAAVDFLHQLGAWVTVGDVNYQQLLNIESKYHGKVNTFFSNRCNVEKLLPEIDLIVNCVRWPKDNKEFLITREMVKSMHKGSVIVDISNDYGVIETFHETNHNDPMYIEEGVVHYCVPNIPSVIAGSTSVANSACLVSHFENILKNGVTEACKKDEYLRRGLVSYDGYLTHEETSKIQNKPWVKPEAILNIYNEDIKFAPRCTSSRSDNYYKEFEEICKKI